MTASTDNKSSLYMVMTVMAIALLLGAFALVALGKLFSSAFLTVGIAVITFVILTAVQFITDIKFANLTVFASAVTTILTIMFLTMGKGWSVLPWTVGEFAGVMVFNSLKHHQARTA